MFYGHKRRISGGFCSECPVVSITVTTTALKSAAENLSTITYRDAAIKLWGPAGQHAHDTYQRLLPLYPGLPDELPIVIGITAYGHCMGLTRSTWEHGPRISLHSGKWGYRRGAGWVEDVIAHEMIHAWLYVTGKDSDHDSDDWYDAINYLSPTILGQDLDAKRGADRKSVRVTIDGKSTVRKVKVEGAIQHGDAARWPHVFRPEGFDYGRPIPVPTY